MQFDDAIRILKDHEADLKKMGVLSLYMFGSTVRGEQRPDSDIDLFFDYDRGNFDAFQILGVERKASKMLGCKADVTTRDGLHPLLKKGIEDSSVRVF